MGTTRTAPDVDETSAPEPTSDADIALAGEIGRGLSQLFRVAARAKARMYAAGELTEWSTIILLAPLIDMGPLRSSALADAGHVDPSRASRMIAHLVELGYVERQADPADGRASIIAITDAGRDAFDRLRKQRDRFLAAVVAGWPERDRKRLAALMTRFVSDLCREERAAEEHRPDARTDDTEPQPKMEHE